MYEISNKKIIVLEIIKRNLISNTTIVDMKLYFIAEQNFSTFIRNFLQWNLSI
jgi:hypothetical protein